MPAPRSQPPLLAALNAAATTKEVNNFVSLDKYYRSASLMQRQAEEYRRAQNTEQLYVILMRLVSLVVETIPKHRTFSADSDYKRLRILCAESALPELERLRLELRLKDTSRLEQEPYQPRKVPGTVRIGAGNVDGLHWGLDTSTSSTNALDVGGDVSILETLGTAAWDKSLPPSTMTVSYGGGGGGGGGATGTALGMTPSLPPPVVSQLPDLSSNLHLPTASSATRAKHELLPMVQQQQTSTTKLPHSQQHQQGQGVAQGPRPLYPSITQSPIDTQLASLSVYEHAAAVGPSPPPPSPYNELQLGPQEIQVQSAPYPSGPPPPPREDGSCCAPLSSQLEVVDASAAGVGVGGVVPVKKRQKLRDVHVSVALMDEFLRFATSNTRRGIETCGILAGSLSADDASFTVCALLIPKQEGTSDTVQALAEEEIFEVQDSRSLYPLGWIHTHPTQTCFMSSVDIHTHCGYQTMLDEAVAIVMAPRDAKTPVGMFRLSTPGGLKLIQQCQSRGFHAHPPTQTGQPIYELCGHVYLNPRAKFEVIDLR